MTTARDLQLSIQSVAGTFGDSPEARGILDSLRRWDAQKYKDVGQLCAIRDRLARLVIDRSNRSALAAPRFEEAIAITLYGSRATLDTAARLAREHLFSDDVTLLDNTRVQTAELEGMRYVFRKVSNA